MHAPPRQHPHAPRPHCLPYPSVSPTHHFSLISLPAPDLTHPATSLSHLSPCSRSTSPASARHHLAGSPRPRWPPSRPPAMARPRRPSPRLIPLRPVASRPRRPPRPVAFRPGDLRAPSPVATGGLRAPSPIAHAGLGPVPPGLCRPRPPRPLSAPAPSPSLDAAPYSASRSSGRSSGVHGGGGYCGFCADFV